MTEISVCIKQWGTSISCTCIYVSFPGRYFKIALNPVDALR